MEQWVLKTSWGASGLEENPNANGEEAAIKYRLAGCSSVHEALAGISVKFKFSSVLVIASLKVIKHSLASNFRLCTAKERDPGRN